MDNKKNKTLLIVLGIFALVIVTTAASFAFFTYSRVGNTTTTITSGDIEFTYKEGDDASLANAFPVSDSVGAQDTSEEYTFTVNMKSSSTANKMNYNVYLLDANDTEGVNYFTNEQIKFALVKNGTYVADTSSTSGKKLSQVAGFTEGLSEGEGLVLENQEIAANTTDEYKLRIWISDDVKYSNTTTTGDGTDENNDTQTSTGKYNSYKYSLKVKITSGVVSGDTISGIKNLNVNKLTMTADLEDANGLIAYAVTQSETEPENNSIEWIDLTTTAKSNVVRTSTITTKSITYMVKKNGTYYLHVKNRNNEVISKSFVANATGENAVDKIVSLADTNTNQLRIDEHEPTGQQNFATKEYRYWGAIPNNYVWFNNELWRIIGAFDVDDGSSGAEKVGNVEKRLKIIRNGSIGDYSWDSSDINTNNGYGINEWSQADLMILLNKGAYYNRTNGMCYNWTDNAMVPCDFSENSEIPGLTDEAKEMTGNAKWYLGSHVTTEAITSDMYGYERSVASSKQCTQNDTYCSDTVERKTNWVGKIGLPYPSDYGYSANFISCSDINLNVYNNLCSITSWLYKNSITQWTLTPNAYPGYADHVFYITTSGQLAEIDARNHRSIFPVTYLLPDIKILDGDGTTDRPFVLSK